jgi:hypothetical protein
MAGLCVVNGARLRVHQILSLLDKSSGGTKELGFLVVAGSKQVAWDIAGR